MKKCTKCNTEKDAALFPKIGNICKECKNEYSKNQKRKLRETNPEKASENKRKYYLNNKEKFQKWSKENRNNIEKKEKRSKYRRDNRNKDREYYLNNKEIISQKRKENYINNKEKYYNKEKYAQYYLDNKEKIKERNLLYRKNNPNKINEARKLWRKNKMENDPIYNLKCKVHNLIVSAFKRAYTKKSKKTVQILGCSYEEFKIYIESKFDESMNWDNHGEYWEMDHITPLSWAKTEEEVYNLNHYTNFQPLIKQINKLKSNYYAG